MDANASAGASFAALNQHAKQLSRTNDKLSTSLASCKHQVQKLSVIQVELKEELKMKQATYVAEVHSRLQYQKSMAKIVDIVQETCNDTRLVENVLNIADDCETEFMNASTLGNEQEQSPPNIQSDNNPVNSPNPITPLKSEKSLMSKFVGSFWGWGGNTVWDMHITSTGDLFNSYGNYYVWMGRSCPQKEERIE